MAITVSCPCGQVLTLQKEQVGQPLSCPACLAQFTIRAKGKRAENAPGKVTAVPPQSTKVDEAPALPFVEIPPETDFVEILPDEEPAAATEEIKLREETKEEILNLALWGEDEAGPYAMQQKKASANFAGTPPVATVALPGPVSCLALAPNHQFALAAVQEAVFFLDLAAQSAMPTQPTHRVPVTALAISPTHQLALSGDKAGGLLVWDAAARRPLRLLSGHRHKITCLAFSPDGRCAVSGDRGGETHLWDLATGGPLRLNHARWEESVACAAFSPDGWRIVAIGKEGKGRLWNLRTGEVLCKMESGIGGHNTAAFRADGAAVLASSGSVFAINCWNAHTGERQGCFIDYYLKKQRVKKTFVTPNGQAILALGTNIEPAPRNGYCLECYQAKDEKIVASVELGPNQPVSLAVSVAGDQILAGFQFGHVNLYELLEVI